MWWSLRKTGDSWLGSCALSLECSTVAGAAKLSQFCNAWRVLAIDRQASELKASCQPYPSLWTPLAVPRLVPKHLNCLSVQWCVLISAEEGGSKIEVPSVLIWPCGWGTGAKKAGVPGPASVSLQHEQCRSFPSLGGVGGAELPSPGAWDTGYWGKVSIAQRYSGHLLVSLSRKRAPQNKQQVYY